MGCTSSCRSTGEVSHHHLTDICLGRPLFSASSSHFREFCHVKAVLQKQPTYYLMAEALAALGLAANIVQFIDFGGRILSEGYRLHKSKVSPSKNEELESIALDLKKLHNELQSPESEISQAPTPNDIQLQRLAEQCRDVCLELLAALEKMKSVDPSGKWRSFRVALTTVWGESKIKSLQGRLDESRQELIVRILMSFR